LSTLGVWGTMGCEGDAIEIERSIQALCDRPPGGEEEVWQEDVFETRGWASTQLGIYQSTRAQPPVLLFLGPFCTVDVGRHRRGFAGVLGTRHDPEIWLAKLTSAI
jgi:hypothetical protein